MLGKRWWLIGAVGTIMLGVACSGAPGSKRSEPGGGATQSMAHSAGAPSSAGVVGASAPSSDAAATSNGRESALGQQTTAASAPDSERKIISTRFLDLTVKDVRASFERIGAIAASYGGLVSDANLTAQGKESRASITIRVPVARQQDALDQVSGLASTVDGARANANDVTEEYVDGQSRIRNLQATEAQLLLFLGQAKNVQEVLQVQDRLTTVRGDIEKAQGRINALGRLTELATIQVQLKAEAPPLSQSPKHSGSPRAALRQGWDASTEVVGSLALAALTLVAFSWWLLPFVALAVWLARRQAGKRQRRSIAPPSDPATA